MEQKLNKCIIVSANGKVIGEVKKSYSASASVVDGDQVQIHNFCNAVDFREERKKLELAWAKLPDQIKKECQQSAWILANTLHMVGGS